MLQELGQPAFKQSRVKPQIPRAGGLSRRQSSADSSSDPSSKNHKEQHNKTPKHQNAQAQNRPPPLLFAGSPSGKTVQIIRLLEHLIFRWLSNNWLQLRCILIATGVEFKARLSVRVRPSA